MTVTRALANDVGIVFSDNTGVVPASFEQIASMIEGTSTLASAIAWGADDTEVRENLADMIAQQLLQTNWPMYADNVDIDVFQAQIERAAASTGWHVVATDGPWPGL